MTQWTAVFRSVIWLLVCAALVGGIASAKGPDACPKLFPDFRCDRHGRYDGFVMPMIAPFLFEDPFITTNVSIHGIRHESPEDSVFRGGDAWVMAVQARVAITDRLAFVATKDGYVWLDNDHPILDDEQGFFDIGAGFKFAVIDRPEDNFILSLIARLDIPVGDDEVFSGNGDGVFVPSVSTAWGVGNFHVIADLGGRIPFDRDKESTSLFYHLHLDYAVLPLFVPFIELAGLHWTDSGDGTMRIDTTLASPLNRVTLNTAQAVLATGSFEGADIVNLGSRNVAGHDLITFAAGIRFPIHEHVSLGAVYEVPITHREDIFNQRVSMNLTFEF
jgi:hypothetical protein